MITEAGLKKLFPAVENPIFSFGQVSRSLPSAWCRILPLMRSTNTANSDIFFAKINAVKPRNTTLPGP
jgi:hypothetical protein